MREAKCALLSVAYLSFTQNQWNHTAYAEHYALQKVQVRDEYDRVQVLAYAHIFSFWFVLGYFFFRFLN